MTIFLMTETLADMKRAFIIFAGLCAVMISGCTVAAPEQIQASTHTVTVKVQKGSDSKTAILEGPTEASYVWTTGDESRFHIYENGVEATSVAMVLSDGDAVATFTATFPDRSASEYVYSAIYAGGFTDGGSAVVPAVQQPTLSSFDPRADVMVSSAEVVSSGTPATELQFSLVRQVTVNKMTLKGLTAGESVKSVILFSDKEFTDGSKLLAFDYRSRNDATVPADGTFPVYMVSGPVLDASFHVYAETDKAVYVRDDFSSKLNFDYGEVHRFGIQLGSYRYTGGTESHPWLLATTADMTAIKSRLAAGEKKWFRMVADVDMESVNDWEPLNYDGSYNKEIDFDGAGHTISSFHCNASRYPGFFGVLHGKCHDLTIVEAEITTTENSSCGILGAYCGTSGIAAEVENVHVEGSVTNSFADRGIGGMFGRVNGGTVTKSSAKCTVTNTGSVTGVGGMFGWISSNSISQCWADCVVTSGNNYVGGLFGYDNGKSKVSDCWTSGSVTGGQRAGGICGGLIKEQSEIRNCYSLSEVKAGFAIGGIAGHCNLDKAASVSPSTTDPKYVIEKCIAWNKSVRTNTYKPGDETHYSSGAIAGYIATHSYLTDCIRRSDLDFLDYTDINTLYDQVNATPEAPLLISYSATYNFPYHGTAAAVGKTLSEVAGDLGWSSEVWDFSGDYPALKMTGVPAESHDWDNNRGKVVTPGEGWTSSVVDDGINLYIHERKDDITGVRQDVYVLDVDMSNPDYAVKFVYSPDESVASDIHAANNAVATINGTFELGSVFTRIDGYNWSVLRNDTIGGIEGGVPNWKSEAAIHVDATGRNVRIGFDGRGRSLDWLRSYYRANTSPNLFSGAPMLVDDFEPVGTSFVNDALSPAEIEALDYEDPNRHQGVRHPRTAVALTENNHFLMIAVDGRYASYGVGMTAKELTQFLVKHFNPRYAMNLDGGGSTTLCVEGKGDATTHVVNYPCDNRGASNNVHNHSGERSVSTYICIVRN